MTAKRVFLGSSEAEYYIYDANGKYLKYWSVYHDGKLPIEIKKIL